MKAQLFNSSKAFVLMITMMHVTSVLYGQNTISEKKDLFIEIEEFNKSHCILYWKMEKPFKQIKFLFQNQNTNRSFYTSLDSGAMQIESNIEVKVIYRINGKSYQIICNCK